MKLLTSALTVLLLLIQPGEAQEGQEKTGSIAGKVVDQRTGQALYPANVVCLPGNHGTTTDARGTFSLTGLPAGSFDLEITYLGYEKSTVSGVALETGQKLDLGELTLFESALSLSEITVSPGTFSVMGNTPLSRQTLSERDLKSMSFAEDITRAVSRLPGVASNDFSSKFTVRGGETDEVLINLDGMELYDPFHQRDFVGGLFSIVDIETIEGVDLLTGGFSAEYGNRQSGVFNLRTRSAGEQGRHTTLGLSVMNAGLYSDGPIMGGKGNYLLSARRGMLDQVFKLIGQDENTPTFYDLLGKVEFPLNAKHRLSLHLLHAGDKTAVRDVTEEAFDIHDTRYGNTYGWLTLNSFFSAKWYSRSYLYGGFLSQKRNGNTQKYEYSDKLVFQLSDQRDFGFAGFKQDWDWSPSEKYFIRFGGDYRRLNSDYQYSLNLQDVRVNAADSLVDFRQQTELSLKPSGHHASGYLSLRMNLLPGVFAEPGIRYEDVSYTGDRLWSPRLGVALALSQHTVLRGAWGYYYQSQDIHKLDVNHATDQFD
ncbi:MAG TPA: TonB-dependent receptor, partial [Calditrichia bacterium]|nr:TonB-dependent receptor [Calditrichia bacterium]